MRTLPIFWQRLISPEGTTCPRCHGTGEEVRRAVARLRVALASEGIVPVLEEREIARSDFEKEPLASNKILIAEKPLEYWIEGQTGRSQCCSECGDSECRTIEVDGRRYEVIPEDLVVRAGLNAAAWLPDAAV
jgi:Domain of unknown function (DUF2703)